MVCLGTLVGWRLVPRAPALSLGGVVEFAVAMNGPSIELDLAKRLFRSLFTAFGPCLWFSLSLADVLKLATLSLFLSSASGIDRSRVAVCALMNLWNMLR
jgi:hypothetical protein